MMSNHSMLVEDLKSKSGKQASNKRRSIYSGVDKSAPQAANLAAAAGVGQSIDRVSVDTLAHEIDAYGKTLEKSVASGNKPPAQRQGSRKVSTSRRGESPLRSGANM